MSHPVMESLLNDARDTVTGPRSFEYGPVERNFDHIAALWSAHLRARRLNFSLTDTAITPSDVGALMILLKVARLGNTPGHRDTLVDIAGYAACCEAVKG